MTESETIDRSPVEPFEARRQRVREACIQGVSDMLDRALEEFVLTGDKEIIIADLAQFLLYILAVKQVEARMHTPTRAALLSAYWPLEKAIKKEVPAMLLQLAREPRQL